MCYGVNLTKKSQGNDFHTYEHKFMIVQSTFD